MPIVIAVAALGALAVAALRFGADSRDTRHPRERHGSWAPLRA